MYRDSSFRLLDRIGSWVGILLMSCSIHAGSAEEVKSTDGVVLSVSRLVSPSNSISPSISSGVAEKRRFGSIFLAVDRTTLNESDNLDITVSILNEMPHAVLELISAEQHTGALTWRIQEIGSGRDTICTNMLSALKRSDRDPYRGERFVLAKNQCRTFYMSLFDDSSLHRKPYLLEPGTYLLQAAYVSTPHPNMGFVGQDSIDWETPLVSGGIRITVLPVQAQRKEALQAARRFLVLDMESPDSFLAEYQRVAQMDLSSSLLKRVRIYAASRLLMGTSAKDKTYRDIAMKELVDLTGMDLEPGERSMVCTLLGDLYFQRKQYDEAKKILNKAGTIRAEFLLRVLQEKDQRTTTKSLEITPKEGQ